MAKTRKIDPDLHQTLHAYINEIKASLAVFSNKLVTLRQDHYLPQMPKFDKEAEKALPQCISLAPSPTEQLPTEVAIQRSFCKIFANPTENTRLAMRYPGYISLNPSHEEQICSMISQINDLKSNLAALVKTSFNNRQTAHNVIHHLFPGLLYQQAIRPIYTLKANCYGYFYWSIRPLVRRLTKEQAFEELDAAKEFRRFDLSQFNKEEMLERIEFEKNIISSVPANKYIIERRIARVQPFYDFYTNDNTNKKKKIACRNASLPLIVFGKVDLVSPLKDYDENQALVDNAPDSIVENLIIARKHWYTTSVPPKK